MTLVKQKRKVNPHMRKVHGTHHKKSQGYMKTYWPYIPIVLILGAAAVVSSKLPASTFSTNSSSAYSSRVSAVIGTNSHWPLYGLYTLLAVVGVWFIARNYKKLRKVAVSSEQILARNYALDVLLALVIGGVYILIR